jgi:hypothetical protein
LKYVSIIETEKGRRFFKIQYHTWEHRRDPKYKHLWGKKKKNQYHKESKHPVLMKKYHQSSLFSKYILEFLKLTLFYAKTRHTRRLRWDLKTKCWCTSSTRPQFNIKDTMWIDGDSKHWTTGLLLVILRNWTTVWFIQPTCS